MFYYKCLHCYSSFIFETPSISAMCGVGQAPDATNPTVCIDCSIGFYSDATDTSACTACASGTTVAAASISSTYCGVLGELQSKVCLNNQTNSKVAFSPHK